MTQKKCFKCNLIKCLSDFYKHNRMKDGYLNKCIKCCKQDSLNNRHKNIDRIRAYDRSRGARRSVEKVKEYRKKYPNKYKAHTMVNNAIRSKKLFKENCEVCNREDSVHAHHDDYLKPLNVRWLCAVCHSKWHLENGEAKNP